MHKEYRSSLNWPYHISCGGPVYRIVHGHLEVLLLSRIREEGITYHLPKGTLHHNETLESCCAREVEEESGCKGDIQAYLGAFTDEFTKNGMFISKTTHYFAILFTEDTGIKDAEHDHAEWFEISEAKQKLKSTEPKKKEYFILDRLSTFLSER